MSIRRKTAPQLFWTSIVFVELMLSLRVESQLQTNFYGTRCPAVELLVRNVVRRAINQNPGLGAGLLRMHFHDCFVQGCDGSVLINSTQANQAEKDSPINNPSLRGFEVIDSAKAQIEAVCPGVVSCADILAFAARDSVFLLNGPFWNIRSGRRDGTASKAADVPANLPPPFFNVQQLTQNFAAKGLSQQEMITLSGAHTIGGSHCSSFASRLYNFNSTTPQDPSLDPLLAAQLKSQCPRTNFDPNRRVGMDSFTPFRFDNLYFTGLTLQRGLFTSDQTLLQDDVNTAETVKQLSASEPTFNSNFVTAMIKMSEIEVKTGQQQGEIRSNCAVIN